MSRPVSARRVLAVVAALLALPWFVWVLSLAVRDGEPGLAVLFALAAALVAASPLLVRWERFGCLAGVLWFALLVLGFLGAFAGGFVLWPAAFVLVIAAIPAVETTWRLGRVLAVVGGVVAVLGGTVAVALAVGDLRDEPDLEVRLRSWQAAAPFTEDMLDEPHVRSVGSAPDVDVSVELEDLTPDMRERLVARLQRDPRVAAVRVVDEGPLP